MKRNVILLMILWACTYSLFGGGVRESIEFKSEVAGTMENGTGVERTRVFLADFEPCYGVMKISLRPKENPGNIRAWAVREGTRADVNGEIAWDQDNYHSSSQYKDEYGETDTAKVDAAFGLFTSAMTENFTFSLYGGGEYGITAAGRYYEGIKATGVDVSKEESGCMFYSGRYGEYAVHDILLTYKNNWCIYIRIDLTPEFFKGESAVLRDASYVDGTSTITYPVQALSLIKTVMQVPDDIRQRVKGYFGCTGTIPT